MTADAVAFNHTAAHSALAESLKRQNKRLMEQIDLLEAELAQTEGHAANAPIFRVGLIPVLRIKIPPRHHARIYTGHGERIRITQGRRLVIALPSSFPTSIPLIFLLPLSSLQHLTITSSLLIRKPLLLLLYPPLLGISPRLFYLVFCVLHLTLHGRIRLSQNTL